MNSVMKLAEFSTSSKVRKVRLKHCSFELTLTVTDVIVSVCGFVHATKKSVISSYNLLFFVAPNTFSCTEEGTCYINTLRSIEI